MRANSGLRVDLAGICLLARLLARLLQCFQKFTRLVVCVSPTLPPGQNVLRAAQMQKRGPILNEPNVQKGNGQPTGGCGERFSLRTQLSHACPTEELTHWSQMRGFSSSNELEKCKGGLSACGGTLFLKIREQNWISRLLKTRNPPPLRNASAKRSEEEMHVTEQVVCSLWR